MKEYEIGESMIMICFCVSRCPPAHRGEVEVEQDMFCFFTMARLCNILRFFTAEKMITKCDIFLIFAQNIDRGYMLEPLH